MEDLEYILKRLNKALTDDKFFMVKNNNVFPKRHQVDKLIESRFQVDKHNIQYTSYFRRCENKNYLITELFYKIFDLNIEIRFYFEETKDGFIYKEYKTSINNKSHFYEDFDKDIRSKLNDYSNKKLKEAIELKKIIDQFNSKPNSLIILSDEEANLFNKIMNNKTEPSEEVLSRVHKALEERANYK